MPEENKKKKSIRINPPNTGLTYEQTACIGCGKVHVTSNLIVLQVGWFVICNTCKKDFAEALSNE